MSGAVKPKLLFLAHLLPWPLEGGGQIKSYHTLHQLSSYFDITMLAFIRGEAERQNVVPLQPLCRGGINTVLLQRSRWRDLAACIRAAGTGGSLLIERDASAAMGSAVRAALTSSQFAAVHVDHLQMMSFVPSPDDPLLEGTRVILDQHNVEHHILQRIAQIGQGTSLPLRWTARWDLPRLRRFEQAACRRADRILVVSKEDASLVTELLGKEAAAEKIRITPIGVDTEYFMPGNGNTNVGRHINAALAKPLRGPILTVGTMYWPPNIDSVQWFCGKILPLVRKDLPEVRFQIVGAKPTPQVRNLGAVQPEVVSVTGTVPDVRPYMAACGVFVVPLRAGSGMRVKILQAMAMGLPIVSTSLGAEGIAVIQGQNILLADTDDDFAEAVTLILTYPALADRLGRAARELAVRQYSWGVAGQELLHVYHEEIGAPAPGPPMHEETAAT
jgi:glycosyltransferase involved in cell wall biosynthesis